MGKKEKQPAVAKKYISNILQLVPQQDHHNI